VAEDAPPAERDGCAPRSRGRRRARTAEEALAAAGELAEAGAEDAKRAEALEGEVAVLRQEREEIRARVEKLVSLLERL
jgi:hypothetical protein